MSNQPYADVITDAETKAATELQGSIPRIRRRSVRIKPSVSRVNHWGPQGRLRAAAKIETTALLMAGQGRRG